MVWLDLGLHKSLILRDLDDILPTFCSVVFFEIFFWDFNRSVDNYNTCGSSIIGPCDCTESFLAGSVPNLKFHTFPLFCLNNFGAVFYSYGVWTVGRKTLVDKLPHDARFSDRCVANYYELEGIKGGSASRGSATKFHNTEIMVWDQV